MCTVMALITGRGHVTKDIRAETRIDITQKNMFFWFQVVQKVIASQESEFVLKRSKSCTFVEIKSFF